MALPANESATAKRFRIAAIILAVASIILSCVFISADDEPYFHFELGAYYMALGLPGLIALIAGVAPGVLLLIGLLSDNRDKQRLFATLAPGAQLLGLFLMVLSSADEISDIIESLPDFIGFPLTFLTIVSLGVSIYSLCAEKASNTVPFITGIVLACLAFVLMLAQVYPFGESYFEEYYVSLTFYNMLIWLSVAFVFYGTCNVAQVDYPKHAKQSVEPVQPNPAPIASISNRTEEIKGLKELLDIGAITQEEYDAKKRQLLDI